MTDGGLRELERAAAGGDAAARARLLRARVRAGATDEAGLALAAYLGDGAAADVTARRAAGAVQDLDTLEDALRGLEPWGKAIVVRATLAAAAFCAPEPDGVRTIATAGRWLDGEPAPPYRRHRGTSRSWPENVLAAVSCGGPFTAVLQACHVAGKAVREGAALPAEVWDAIRAALLPDALGEGR